MKNNSILSEINRSLTLMGVKKILINEGRGELGNRIWSLVLGLGEESSELLTKRINSTIDTLLDNTNKNTAQRILIKRELLEMISARQPIKVILEYMEEKLTPKVVDALEKKLEELGLLPNQIRASLLNDLNENPQMTSDIIEDTERALNDFVEDTRFISSSYADKIKKLTEFKKQLANMYSTYFGVDVGSLGYKKILDVIDEPFEKQIQTVESGGTSLRSETQRAVDDLKNSREWVGDAASNISPMTRLEKIAKLRKLLNDLQTSAKEKLELVSGSQTKIKTDITDIIEAEIKAIEDEVKGLMNTFRTGLKNWFPKWSDLMLRIETSTKKRLEEIQKDLDDIAVAMGGTNDVGPELAQRLRSKFASLVGKMDPPKLEEYWVSLQALIIEAYGEKEGGDIIRLAKSGGEKEEDWFTFLMNEARQGTDSKVPGWGERTKHFWLGWSNALSSFSQVKLPGLDRTWIKRVVNNFLTSQNITFRELMDSFIKAQYAIPGLKVGKFQGYKWKNVLYKWVQLWLYAKVFPSAIYSILYGVACGVKGHFVQKTPEEIEKMSDEQKKEYDERKNFLYLIAVTFKEEFVENFDVFFSSSELVKKYGGSAEDYGLLYRVGEAFDMVFPAELLALDIYNWLETGLNMPYEETLFAKTKKAADEKKQEVIDLFDQSTEKAEEKLDKGLNADERLDKVNSRGKIETFFNEFTDETYKKTKAYKFIEKNLQWSSNKRAHYIVDPVDKNILYYIDDDNDPTKSIYIKSSDGQKWNYGKEYGDFVKYLNDKVENENKKRNSVTINNTKPSNVSDSIIKKITNMILENNSGKKFGDDNFKHWKDTFTFKAIDEKNPGQYKEVKINMEDVMDRINHYRKKYDEDDAFVRAVIDTHEDVVKVMFTKDLAHLQETHKPLGLALILQQISESRGEMEIWSVARPANGNWFLVKGDYTPKQMVTMDLQKNEPRNKETKVVTRAEDDLKKKEIAAIQKLKNDEKSGLEELPIKVREKVKEKISRGWTTEVPFETFDVYYKKSEINSAFNEKIKIYKLIPSNEFFNSLIKNSSRIRAKRGFCKSISNITNEFKMTESQQKIADHILNTCNRMYGNQKLKKYKPVNQND